MAEMAGVLRRDGNDVDSSHVEQMLLQLGPGVGNGVVLLHEAAMIHTRFDSDTRINLDARTERQPVQNSDGTLCATVLGRPQWGETSQHSEDALIPRELLEFYQARGPAAFRYLWGQWAVAIWDAPRQRLVLSRGWEGSPRIWTADEENTLIYATSPTVFGPNVSTLNELDAQDTRLVRVRQLAAATV